ncbi:non-canonical purine NTP pyrophosphatase, RdgB/HAM1 family/ribonuclease PH,TIGR01966 [Anaerosphaera aminiphila DSM 21120]|uniref:Multifunctional fusion protein n=1 Tax=Anaerosphaera aminiphila DSM 21120 TaxID=1120995 RepID=A0A1M5RIM0_9FIRM|nr:ribonuclease PH [Anaerosphaera aminiphila]SHH25663.1 non-canonical purine NTP pyrophosphatase, RdgB/HAM1 family/ribonuclease PH,TIGR01966 [Anaerosphaera aminiphila DSM 21120]
MRADNRGNKEIRNLNFQINYTPNPDGSVLVECGNTKIICTAMIEDKVPFFLKGSNSGWLSCEYSMLPSSTQSRKVRDISKGKIDGRSQEIQRLIGRSLRSCIDLKLLGEKTIWIDCDVISADGGTRTASINGAFVALKLAIEKSFAKKQIQKNPLISNVAAISVGIVKGEKLLDLDYLEDSKADVDLNVVMNSKKEIIEIQGTAEGNTFSRYELNELLDIAELGIEEILNNQEEIFRGDEVIILSTDNEHKVKEIKDILYSIPVEIISKKQAGLSSIQVEENLDTLEGNARLKALALKEKSKHSVIADDTGLFVEYLNGDPGVHSARYAGEHDDKKNRELLLENLKDTDNRRAYFKTILVYIDELNEEYIFEGICNGHISKVERGDKSFGYDCIFIPNRFEKTFGEMSSQEKNAISHRQKAVNKFKNFLQKKYKI